LLQKESKFLADPRCGLGHQTSGEQG
jgi:hypothetical protein